MTQEVPVTQAREELADLVNRVAYGHERITLTRHGKPLAALVPPEDLAWLEQRSKEKITLTMTGHTLGHQQPAATPEVMPLAAEHQPRHSAPQPKPPRASR